ncbi:hypothetical protein SLE2022_185030 [Rubroshorea leprosula]
MELIGLLLRLFPSFTLIGLVCYVLHLYNTVWLKSLRLRRKLLVQGIKGPPPSILYGNALEMQQIKLKAMKTQSHSEIVAHDYTSTIFPYFDHWRKQYGLVYTYSTGLRQHLYVNDPELVKEMSLSNTLDLGKASYMTKRLQPMLGNGVIRANGHLWAHQRKIIAPEFFLDRVKDLVGLMIDSTQPLLRKWEEYIEAEGGGAADIQVDGDLRSLTADVIARACFGSSYSKGKEIFSKLRILQTSISQQSTLFGMSNFGFLPNKEKNKISSLEKEIETLIWETVKGRQTEGLETSSYQNDLLQLILEGATSYANVEWQSRIRTEVAQVCKNGLLDADSVSRLKTVTMVIQESLRLYTPAAFVAREALEDVRIGNIAVPKGTCIWTLIPTLHRDPEIWGTDANEFNPDRFSNGISKACKIPQAYVPFGLGPRLCLGKNFAMVQLKVVLSLIVSRFTFSLSPVYRHSPTYRMLVEPEHGVHIRMQKI